MKKAPYHRTYRRARPGSRANPACHLTDQGADPRPIDPAWCIFHAWRVIYYSARHAAGLPIWSGVEDFEFVMIEVLCRLSRGFKPIPPVSSRRVAMSHEQTDGREDRIYQASCRVFRAPVFKQRDTDD
ncbi:MAG TPA: hypothetical protein VKU02_11190 [Gemmataceae bacterium]|nr:hypothetical protein [Gemmataceae bacterium]